MARLQEVLQAIEVQFIRELVEMPPVFAVHVRIQYYVCACSAWNSDREVTRTLRGLLSWAATCMPTAFAFAVSIFMGLFLK